MKGVRFSKAEVAALRWLDDTGAPGPHERARASAMNKLAMAELAISTPHSTSVSVKEAVHTMERVLGVGNVAMPPRPDGEWFARIGNHIKRQRLTAEDFVKMARVLDGRGWKPPFSFERAVMSADRLLTEAAGGAAGAKGGSKAAPVDMEDL